MPPSKLPSRIRSTQKKIAAIVLLSVVLVVVWERALMSSDAAPMASASALPDAKVRDIKAPDASEPDAEPPSPRVGWPTLSLKEIVQNDPFHQPVWSWPLASANEASSAIVETSSPVDPVDLEKQTTTSVVITPHTKMATIGDRLVRVGDRFKGFFVVDITSSGVVLSTTPATDRPDNN